ncbi:MAM and LDL-receptor class A domain-containing 2-like, partial [Paramuricea clavata]
NEYCSLNNLGCLDNLRNGTFCEDDIDGNCDFEENGFCEWHQVIEGYDDLDWILHKGDTPSEDTGPKVDHTRGSAEGFYIYIETSYPAKEGDKAIIEAGPFKADQNLCFIFYYHMFGEHIGGLSVYRMWWNRTNIELLWTRNTWGIDHWEKASLDVGSGENFYLMIEAVAGGWKGDIALDDFSLIGKHCSEVENDNSPFCSFEKPCTWKTIPPLWNRTLVNTTNKFILQDYFLRMNSPGRLEITLNEEMTALYQCITFWYKFHNVTGGSLKSIQKLFDGNVIELSHTLEATTEQWVFSEMPLQRKYTNSKIFFDVLIPEYLVQPYLDIDEINLSSEPCIGFQQGNPAWIPKSSMFYKSLTKCNSDGSITAFYTPPFSSSDREILDNFESHRYSPSFIETLNLEQAKDIVPYILPSVYSNFSVGNRILVEERANTAALGTVIGKENVSTYSDLNYKLTVRLHISNTVLLLGNQSVWKLPHQLNQN